MKNKIWRYIFLIATLMMRTGQAHASENDMIYTFDEVVVTATRTASVDMESNANLSVITRKQIEDNHYRSLAEALRSVPGIALETYGEGGGYELYNTLYLNGSNQFVVLIDGVRANTNGSPFNAFSFSGFKDMGSIERIEVLKGSASTLYGADAKGGVIHIITKQATEPETTVTTGLGSYGRESYQLHHQDKDKDLSWTVDLGKHKSGSYSDGQGFIIPAYQKTISGQFKVTKYLDDNSDVTFQYSAYQSNSMYTGTKYQISSGSDKARRKYGDFDHADWKLTYQTQFADGGKLRLSAYDNRNFMRYDNAYIPNLDSFDQMRKDIRTTGFSGQYTNTWSDRHIATGGFDYYQDKIYHSQDSLNDYRNKKIINGAFYLQDEWNLDKLFNLTTGIRWDDNSYGGSYLAPSIVLGYRLNQRTGYYISYKEHFVSPTQYQLFSQYGNTSLRPESGATRELGLHHKIDDSLSMKAHVFQRNSKDVIVFNKYDSTSSHIATHVIDGEYVNLNEEKTNGWDVQFVKKFSDTWGAFLGYTHMQINRRMQDGRKLIDKSVPRGALTVGTSYSGNKLDMTISGNGIFDRGAKSSGQYDSVPEHTYWLWNTAMSYQLSKQSTLFFKVNNIFNQYYTELASPLGNEPDNWYPGPGRNYQLGITYRF